MERQPTAAFVLSLLAGLWMLASAGMMYGMGAMHGPGFADDGAWMWNHHGLMRGTGLWFPWLGPIAGAVVLTGAAVIYSRPERSGTWGLIILAASAIGLLVGMGGLPAGTLGVIGGALAMSWKPGSKD